MRPVPNDLEGTAPRRQALWALSPSINCTISPRSSATERNRNVLRTEIGRQDGYGFGWTNRGDISMPRTLLLLYAAGWARVLSSILSLLRWETFALLLSMRQLI